MARSEWNLAYVRPANHPLRRLAAAAELWTRIPTLESMLLKLDTDQPSAWLSRVQALFQEPVMPCLCDGSSVQDPSRLIGPARAAAILANVVVPWLMAQARPVMHLLKDLPAEGTNTITRQAAHALLGPDCNPALYHSGLRQQGLIQVFTDFCLDRHNPCDSCRLVAALQNTPHLTLGTGQPRIATSNQ